MTATTCRRRVCWRGPTTTASIRAGGDHDVVLVPRGHHPGSVPYGYESYYLNVMAGPRRVWKFHNDPQHEWLLER